MMIFLMKKIVSGFFQPLPVILILLLAGLLWAVSARRRRGWGLAAASTAAAVLAVVSFSPIPDFLLGGLEGDCPSYSKKASGPVDVVVVLGGGIGGDKSLPPLGRLGSGSLQRLAEGIRVAVENPESRLLLSGGAVFGADTEASVMAEASMALGFPAGRIDLEEKSMDTAGQASALSETLKGKRFCLVTSASHMPRSLALFRKAGMDPIPAPAAWMLKKGGPLSPEDFFPAAGNLRKLEVYLHEFLGFWWARLIGFA